MFKNITLTALLIAFAGIASVANADMIYLDKGTQGDGNKTATFRPWTDSTHTTTANFVLTARTGVDETQPTTADATGLAGTIYIEKADKKGKLRGAGVQTASGGGSKGISGGGGDRDEELIFTYDQAVYVNSVSIMLTDIEFGDLSKSGSKEGKDDPVIFLQTAGSNSFNITVTESDILGAFSYIGNSKDKVGVVNFNNFISSMSLAEDTALVAFKIRETNGHLYVNGMSTGDTAVPEPATMSLLACGGLVLLKRKRRAKA